MGVKRWSGIGAITLTGVLLALVPGGAAEPARKAGADPQEWDRVVDRAINYLKGAQADDGSWSHDKNPGVTGIALTGLLQTGKVTPNDPVAERALKYIESLINTKA